ncbi:MAG: response regulator [Thermoleophilia bacterium]
MERALIVEDDQRVAFLHRTFLEAAGFQVVGVARGVVEALEELNAQREGGLELVLLDLYLPDGHGLDLLPELPGIYTIVITAAKDASTVERALFSGAMDYLIKPFSQTRLKEALSRYRAFRSMVQKGEVSQADLDRLLARKRLSKGLDALTRARVLRILEAAPGPLTTEEVAQSLGLSRVTAWRYLEGLLAEGVVEVEPRYRRPGRPSRSYRLQKLP